MSLASVACMHQRDTQQHISHVHREEILMQHCVQNSEGQQYANVM